MVSGDNNEQLSPAVLFVTTEVLAFVQCLEPAKKQKRGSEAAAILRRPPPRKRQRRLVRCPKEGTVESTH